MARKTKAPNAQQLSIVAQNYHKDIKTALRRLVEQRVGNENEIGLLLGVIFDDIQIEWMVEEYQQFVFEFTDIGNSKGETIGLLKACQQHTLGLTETLNILVGGGWRQLSQAYNESANGLGKLSFHELESLLINLYLAAQQAEKVFLARPDRKGGLADRKPEKVARVAAAQYNRITSKEPSRTFYDKTKGVKGSFPDFLKTIYAALGIAASVDANAKAAASWWKERDPLEFPHMDRLKPPTKPGMEK